MDAREVLALYDRTMRADPRPTDATERVERTAATVRVLGAGTEPRDNTVLASHLDARNADEAIGAELAYFARLGRGFEWKLYGHDRPADLGARLSAHGLSPEDSGTLMALDLAAALPEAPPPSGIELRRLADAGGLADVVRVQDRAWSMDHGWVAAALAREMAEDAQSLAIFLAYAGLRPVAASWVRFYGSRPFASLWGGSTVPEWRGRGIYRALVARRAQLARERGVRYLTVDAGPDSRPILERLGFVALTSVTDFVWRPEGAGA